MSSAGLVEVYIADPTGAATPILVDALSPPFTAPTQKVTLTVAVAQLCPPGWPSPPDETGATPVEWFPHTIASGTTLNCFASVAAALIAAGAATPA